MPAPIQGSEIPLAETHAFTGFGFSIDYPSGWLAETRMTVTAISELEVDQQRSFGGESRHRNGYSVTLEHRGLGFMSTLGLPANPSLEDLLKLYNGIFNWQAPVEVSETVIFGVPALKVETHDSNDNWDIYFMGYLEDEAFLFLIGAPSEQALAEIMPTWTRMLESIKPETALFLRVIAPLDEARGYCLDIPGHMSSVQLGSPLQVHTCKHGIWNQDGRFDVAAFEDGVIRMPHYELCLQAESTSIGARLLLAECTEAELQTWTLQDSGEIALEAFPQRCITVEEGPGRDAGGPRYLIRSVGLDTCAPQAGDRQKWTTVVPR